MVILIFRGDLFRNSCNVCVPPKHCPPTGLGSAATISAVLYANTNHPEWKTEFPNWVDRCKQILKKWRALPAEQKAPYLQQARDNRSAIRMRKAQQVSSSVCRVVVCANPTHLHTVFFLPFCVFEPLPDRVDTTRPPNEDM